MDSGQWTMFYEWPKEHFDVGIPMDIVKKWQVKKMQNGSGKRKFIAKTQILANKQLLWLKMIVGKPSNSWAARTKARVLPVTTKKWKYSFQHRRQAFQAVVAIVTAFLGLTCKKACLSWLDYRWVGLSTWSFYWHSYSCYYSRNLQALGSGRYHMWIENS